MPDHRILLIAALSITVLPSTAFAQRGGGAATSGGGFMSPEINVRVRNEDGTPAPRGTHVVLESVAGGVVDDCRTRADDGVCHFVPQEKGSYIVRLVMQGYKEDSATVNLILTEKGSANLTLRRLPGEKAAAAPKDATGASVSAADLAVPDNARKEYDAGQKALDARDIDGGIAHLQKAIGLYDNFPQAYTTLGAAYVEQKKYKDAQAALQKAIQLDSKAVIAYIELGAALNQLRDYPGAVTALTKGLDLNPDMPAADYELAKSYMALQQWQNAEAPLRKAIAGQPDLVGAHIMLGNVLLKKGDGQGALNEFQTYLKLAPDGPMAQGARDIIPKIEAALAAKQQQK